MYKLHKRIISFFLAFILSCTSVFFSFTTVKADTFLQYPIDFTKLAQNLFIYARDSVDAGIDGGKKLGDVIIDSLIKGYKAGQDLQADYGVTYDEESNQFYLKQNSDNTVTLNQNFINFIQKEVNNSIYALDGYFLVIPNANFTVQSLWDSLYYKSKYSDYEKELFFSLYNSSSLVSNWSDVRFIDTANTLFYIDNYYKICSYNTQNSKFSDYISTTTVTGRSLSDSGGMKIIYNDNFNLNGLYKDNGKPNGNILNLPNRFIGVPFKLFYSKNDLINYVNKGKQYYSPNLPTDSSGSLTVPTGFFDTNLSLPDIGVSFDSLVGKMEENVQTDIDLALKNYIDKLLELNKPSPTSAPTPTVPLVRVTPTPDIGDRPVSPTPTPPVSDSSDTNKWLEQIYNWLLDFGDKHETFVEKISEYIENTDGKLDQIIEAIDKLSQGDTQGENSGCKYDYTALSEFMTSLWNSSDKKFDKMIDLLEENNYYQQRIIDALNDIIWTLKKESVLDTFRNRSRQTADKAKEKFPTSLPWDIALVVNAFSADSVEPVIEIPIKIDSLNVNEKIVIDLSTEEWAKLAKTCRYLLSILFVLYMIHLSRKFFTKEDD